MTSARIGNARPIIVFDACRSPAAGDVIAPTKSPMSATSPTSTTRSTGARHEIFPAAAERGDPARSRN
jgi:hypothetical protein